MRVARLVVALATSFAIFAATPKLVYADEYSPAVKFIANDRDSLIGVALVLVSVSLLGLFGLSRMARTSKQLERAGRDLLGGDRQDLS